MPKKRCQVTDGGGPTTSTFGALQQEVARRRRLEQELRAKRQKLRSLESMYQLLLDQGIAWEFCVNPVGEYLFSSAGCKEILGIEPSALYEDVGLFRRLVHPADRDMWDEHARGAIQDPGPRTVTFRIVAVDGSTRWIEHHCKPLFDATGQVCGARGINLDITERRHADDRLRAESERTAILLEMYARAPRLTPQELYEFALRQAVALTQSKVGFFHLVADDQKTIVFSTWSEGARRSTASYDTRFSVDLIGNWVECVRQKRALVFNESEDVHAAPDDHTPVWRFASVPVVEGDKVRMVFGVGNKAEPYDEYDVLQLQLVANELKKIMAQRAAEEATRRLNAELEQRIKERMAEVEESNRLLREREAQLLVNEVRYRTLFESASDAIFVLRGARFVECNAQTLSIFRCSQEQIVGATFWQLSPPRQPDGRPSRELGLELLDRVLQGEPQRFEWLHHRLDGTQFHAEVTLTRLGIGGEILVQGIVRDVTERKHAEAALRQLSRAVEASPAAVMITDCEGKIEYVNPQFTVTTGYPAHEAVGRNPRILKSGRHSREFYRHLWDAISCGREWRGTLCNRRKSGELYWEAAAIAPLRDEHGQISHFVAVKEDITAVKRVAEELEKAKTEAEAANRLKSVFLATMSHEIRTPMNAILGFTQLLLHDPTVGPMHREHLDIVKRSGEHLLGLIDDILDVAELEAGCISLEAERLDFHALLKETGALFQPHADKKRLHLRVETDPAVPRFLQSDEGRIRQVLGNLLDNAVKFTQQGGIAVRATARPVEQDDNDEEKAPLFLCSVEVEDTGKGISEEEMDRVFTPFGLTQGGGGSGLGLSICKQLARMMGGDLTMTSSVRQGTVFRFTFQAPSLL